MGQDHKRDQSGSGGRITPSRRASSSISWSTLPYRTTPSSSPLCAAEVARRRASAYPRRVPKDRCIRGAICSGSRLASGVSMTRTVQADGGPVNRHASASPARAYDRQLGRGDGEGGRGEGHSQCRAKRGRLARIVHPEGKRANAIAPGRRGGRYGFSPSRN